MESKVSLLVFFMEFHTSNNNNKRSSGFLGPKSIFQPIQLQQLRLQSRTSRIFPVDPVAPAARTGGGRLTVEPPVGYGRHGDAALEGGALREQQEGGEESSVGLQVGHTALQPPGRYLATDWLFSQTPAALPSHRLQLCCRRRRAV